MEVERIKVRLKTIKNSIYVVGSCEFRDLLFDNMNCRSICNKCFVEKIVDKIRIIKVCK